jgi:hypothetical protein
VTARYLDINEVQNEYILMTFMYHGAIVEQKRANMSTRKMTLEIIAYSTVHGLPLKK